MDTATMTDWAGNVPADGEIFAEVWGCGDDSCNCAQARIWHRIPNPRIANAWQNTTLWWGVFWSDGEWADATHELNREARRLYKHHHDLHRRIMWPWDVGA